MNIGRIETIPTDLPVKFITGYYDFDQNNTEFDQKDFIRGWLAMDFGDTFDPYLLKYFTNIFIEIKEGSSQPNENDENIINRIQEFITAGQVDYARYFLAVLPEGISPKVDNWRKVLSVPKAKSERSATGVDIKQNFSWLNDNFYKFKGQWVALNRGILLGSHKSRIELRQSLKQTGKLKEATFFKIEKD